LGSIADPPEVHRLRTSVDRRRSLIFVNEGFAERVGSSICQN